MTGPVNAGGPVVFLTGPTAAGKTALAVTLVERLPLAIVSVDSAMVYRGMNIGTGKPDAETLARAPHRLIDVRDPHEIYSAAEFRADALREMAAIRASGRVPLLVGGTRLYFRALRDGLAALPAADARVRARIEAAAAERGWPAMHARLQELDPAAAARIHPNDPQRIQRALEVHALCGRPLSDLLERPADGALDGPVHVMVIEPALRERLHARIATRFRDMVRRGLAEELRELRRDPRLDPALPSMRAVGYRHAWNYLDGRITRDQLVDAGIIATRQLARRQLTWLRAERSACRLDCFDDGLVERARAWLGTIGIGAD